MRTPAHHSDRPESNRRRREHERRLVKHVEIDEPTTVDLDAVLVDVGRPSVVSNGLNNRCTLAEVTDVAPARGVDRPALALDVPVALVQIADGTATSLEVAAPRIASRVDVGAARRVMPIFRRRLQRLLRTRRTPRVKRRAYAARP